MFYRSVESLIMDMKICHPDFSPVYDQLLRSHIRTVEKNKNKCSKNITDEIKSIREEICDITKSLKTLEKSKKINEPKNFTF